MALSPERKAARVTRLVDIAQQLIREGGNAGFSMGQLAQRAGVSPATPYNLVGPKREILRRVVFDEFDRFSAKLVAHGLEHDLAGLLGAVDLIVDHYEGDRDFYAGLFAEIYREDGADVRETMLSEGRKLWIGIVQGAIDKGDLRSSTLAAPLTENFLRNLAITTMVWSSDGWTHARFTLEMRHMVRLLVTSALAAEKRDRMIDEIEGLASQLAGAMEKEQHLKTD